MLVLALTIRADVEEIQDLIADGKLNKALNEAELELKRDPENVNYRFLRGLILIRLNRLEQAEKQFREITVSHPELPEPYNNLAVIYASMGEFDKAREALEEAINTHPSYATAHENMGDIYAKLASQAYNQALELDQENVTAKAKLALVNDLFSMPRTGRAALANVPQPAAEPDKPERAASGEADKRAAAAETESPPATPPSRASSPGAGKQPSETVTTEVQTRKVVSNVRAAVSDWAKDWSNQDVEGYLAHYAGEFTPPAGQTLADWKRERRDRLTSPRFIRVEISDLTVEMLGDEHAQATFTQKYQSDTYGDLVTKLLLFTKQDGNWLIVQEATK